MKRAICAILHHRISTDKKPQHSKCPTGVSSCCKAKGEKPGSQKLHVGTPIKESFLPHIISIYQRLAANELLERCVNCGTLNANESLHNMIWSVPKRNIFALRSCDTWCNGSHL
ncbi:uncharacterized protein NPIL_134421 [Nephila pilipes]|uniref:Uncharacterized protein n=1 Tax=Nephila pilipes TaxID=299642 RepID=A0A8X6MT05_NEPPI|nr:uncharacterized protein NPIL_134421 [Nephila pilipes]